MGYGVPDMTELRSRARLSTLGAVEHGDVFYTVIQPRLVWRRNLAAGTGEFEFQCLGDEVWYTLAQLGSPASRVVILHNTNKPGE